MNQELYHYGVKGMKWGVKRYQNYDGSYTRAGMKRFNDSLDKYEKANTRYQNAKQNKSSKTELTNARMAKKQAKRRLNKDYKHLRQDKLGDKGKDLYSRGKTITGNSRVTNILSTVGGLSLSAALHNHQTGQLGKESVTKMLAGVGIGTMAVAGLKKTIDYSQNKKLRAYYNHTSNY